MLADGDGEADIHFAADRDQGTGIEAAVGPHRELSPGPAVAHPSHRLTQEVGGAPSGVGAALTQPRHQHVAGSGGNGQQRVIKPLLAGVAVVAGAFLGQTMVSQWWSPGSSPWTAVPTPTLGGVGQKLDQVILVASSTSRGGGDGGQTDGQRGSFGIIGRGRKRGIDGDVDFLREALRVLVDGILRTRG